MVRPDAHREAPPPDAYREAPPPDAHREAPPPDALDAFYSPRSVVVLGASRRPGKLGHDVMVECARLGFSGAMYGVNPLADGEPIGGWPVVRSVHDLPEVPDLALVALAASGTLDAVAELARAGVRAAVLAAAGLGELGGEAALVEQEIAQVARSAGMRLLGPNGFGLYAGSVGLNLTGWREVPAGRVALLTQSGNVAIALCRIMARSTIGVSSCTGIGNQLDVDVAELLEHHARSADAEAIALYVEGLRATSGRRLVQALAACAQAGKPVVVLKGGRSAAASRSVATHTGALGGDRRLWDAALLEGGARQVADPAALVDALEACQATRGRRALRGVLVLSDGGGDTVLTTDALEDAGVPLAPLGPRARTELDALAPPSAPRVEGANPVTLDTAGGLEDDPRLIARCAEAGAADDAVDAVVVSGTFGGYRGRRAEELDAVARLAALARDGTPVLVHSAFAADDEEPVTALRRAGIPVYPTARRLANALAAARAGAGAAASASGRGRSSPASGGLTAPPAEASVSLPTAEALARLAAGGVAVPQVTTVWNDAELADVVARMPFPLCLKLEDPEVSHKSDVGGVVLDVAPGAAADAAHALWQRFPGRALVVMPMLSSGVELLVGLGRDPTFGAFVIVGRGGVAAEVDPDVAIALAPVSSDAALALWASLRCAPLLRGWRGQPGVDLGSLAELVAAMSELALREPRLEIECNPVLAYEVGYAVADVRARERRA